MIDTDETTTARFGEYDVRLESHGGEEYGSSFESPFGRGALFLNESPEDEAIPFESELVTPFDESMASMDEAQLEHEAVAAFVSELEDEEFEEALEALANEAAARHMRSLNSWSGEASSHELAVGEVEQWMESLADSVDQRLDELDMQLGDRPIAALTEAELDLIHSELGEAGYSPFDAQEFFFKKLFKKAKKAVKSVGKMAKKGVRALSKLLPMKKLFSVLKKLVRPLIKRVVRRAIGKLPRRIRPIARKLARRFGAEAEADFEADWEEELDDEGPTANLALEFDELLTEAILAPDDAMVARLVGEYESAAEDSEHEADPIRDLDVARRQLAEQLLEAEAGQAPIEQMEQFLPAVLAARPIIKLGIKIIGRKRVVKHLAKLIARLIQGIVGRRNARMLSRHIASTGLRVLGFEAESAEGEQFASEALVATVEDTVNGLLETPEVFENELLLEAAVQEVFAEAAINHLPAELFRSEVLEASAEEEHGMWVMMPRQGPAYRYKKYSRPIPIRITRPLASSVIMSEGETLEERMLDAGLESFPVDGEIDVYEMLPGAEIGHLAAFELGEDESIADGALEFEELAKTRGLPLPAAMRKKARLRRGRGGRRPGRRVIRLRVRGAKLKRRSRFALRLDMSGTKPQLRLHVVVGERDAHLLVTHLKRRRHIQVISSFRKLLGPGMRTTMRRRLTTMLKRRRIKLSEGEAKKMVDRLAGSAIKEIAERLPAMATELERAAKDPARGVTVTITYVFASKKALAGGKSESQSLKIRPGPHRD